MKMKIRKYLYIFSKPMDKYYNKLSLAIQSYFNKEMKQKSREIEKS